jgi:hypothetical protein
MGMHIDLQSESTSAEFLRRLIPLSPVITCQNPSKKSQHTPAMNRRSGRLKTLLVISPSQERLAFLRLASDHARSLLNVGGGLLRAYKYHTRKASQAIIVAGSIDKNARSNFATSQFNTGRTATSAKGASFGEIKGYPL